MAAFLLPAAMAAAGLLKSELLDKEKEKRQRWLAAQTQRLSPWTGLQANKIEEADPMGSALSYGTTGLGLEQQMESSDARNKFLEKLGDAYSKQGATPENITAASEVLQDDFSPIDVSEYNINDLYMDKPRNQGRMVASNNVPVWTRSRYS